MSRRAASLRALISDLSPISSGTVTTGPLDAGHRRATHNQGTPGEPVLVRLERKGGRIIGAFSNDRLRRKGLKPMDTTRANGPVKAGLLTTNTSSEPRTVKFENCTLKTR